MQRKWPILALTLVLPAIGALPARAATRSATPATLAGVAAQSAPGDVVQLAPAAYGAIGQISTLSQPGVTFVGTGARETTLLGKWNLRGVHVTNVTWPGETGDVGGNGFPECGGNDSVSVDLESAQISNFTIVGNEGHAGAFVSGGTANSIAGGTFSRNGCFRHADNNNDHAVYWANGSGEVVGNHVDGSAARGIQVYGSASDVLIAGNVVTNNLSAGILIDTSGSGIRVDGNVIERNGAGSLGGPGIDLRSGSGSVTNNRTWANQGAPIEQNGGSFVLSGNANAPTLGVPPGVGAPLGAAMLPAGVSAPQAPGSKAKARAHRKRCKAQRKHQRKHAGRKHQRKRACKKKHRKHHASRPWRVRPGSNR